MNQFLKQLVGAVLALFLFAPAQAAIAKFDWQPRPMQAGEIANIVFSPSNPDILYLGVEVNSHSFYKSKDGGKSWFRIDNGDHAKDVTVHPTNPDIALYADSQQVWRTDSGGERLVPVSGPCDSFREKCASAYKKVISNDSPPGPSETSFSSLAFSPSNSNVIYASISGGDANPFGRPALARLWRSDDTGKTWQELKGELAKMKVVVVDPNDENKLWIGASDGVYFSQDAGKTQTKLTSARGVAGISTVDGKTIIAASQEGILYSQDTGKTWLTITDGLPSKIVLRVQISPSSPNIVWATTYEGVAKSTDAGKTWQDASGDLPAKNLQALAVHPTNPEVALIANDTFVFSVRSTGLFRRGQYYDQAIYRTEDGGKSWARSDQGLIEDRIEEISAHPTRAFEVWAGQQASRGFFRSRDAGQTWSLSPGLLTHYPMRHAFSLKNPDQVFHSSLHIGESFGISTDSGVNWTILDQNTFFNALNRGKNLLDRSRLGGANIHIHGLAVDTKNPDIIYVGTVNDPSQFNEKALSGAHIFKSTDGGKTWAESDEGFEHEAKTSIHDIKIDPNDTAIIYVATTSHEAVVGNGLWKSTDSGTSWQRADKGMSSSEEVSVVVVHPKDGKKLLAGSKNGIYRSLDSADSWQKIKDGSFWDIEYDPSDPEIVYAGGRAGVLISKDFGLTWQDITNNLPSKEVTALAVDVTGKIVYAGVDGGVHGYGVYAAYDPSMGEIKKDTSKTQLGKGYGDYQGPTFGPPQAPFSGGQPPTWFKAVIGGIGAVIVLTIGFLIYKMIRRRQ